MLQTQLSTLTPFYNFHFNFHFNFIYSNVYNYFRKLNSYIDFSILNFKLYTFLSVL